MDKKEQKKITLTYTEEEIQEKILELENDEDIMHFMKTQKGARKYEEYLQLRKTLEK